MNTKNAVDICDEPVDFNQQSTFGKNKFSSFNSLKKVEWKKTKKRHESPEPISDIVSYRLEPPNDQLSTSDSN